MAQNKQTYGDVASQGFSDVLGGLLKFVQGASQANPINMGANVGYGLQQGIANTPVGQNAIDLIMQKVADKELTNRYATHAKAAPDEALAAYAAPLYTSNKQNNAMDNANSPTGMAQAQQQYMGAPQAQTPNQVDTMSSTTSPMQPQQPNLSPLQMLGNLLGIKGGNVVNNTYQPRQAFGFLGETPESIMAHAGALKMGQETTNLTPEGALALKTAESKTPMNTYEKASLGYTALKNQADTINNQLERAAKDEEALQKQFDSYKDVRGPIKKGLGGSSKEMVTTQAQIDKLRRYQATLHTQLASVYNGGGSQGVLHVDAKGNTAYKMPDGSWKPA